jgi:hypothetical protein
MFRVILLASIALLVSCSEEDGNPATDRDANASATYTVSFTSEWKSTDFPTNFPGGPHFSGLIGATHSDQVKFWEPGQLASTGIEQMAETGNKLALLAEVETAKREGSAEFVLSGSGVSSPGTVSLEFDINETYPLVTLVSMMAPSPDWFVGVRDLELYDGAAGDWKANLSVDLLVYDAGTDDGPRFTSANADAQPPGIVAPLTSDVIDTDFVNGLHGITGKHAGSMVFTRIK